MPPIRKDDAAIAVGALLLLGGGVAFAATGDKKKLPAKALPDADQDGANLVKRATQNAAMRWVTDFMTTPHAMSPMAASALSRWAGIESSGNATVKSRLGEVGLMQAGPQTVSEGGLTQAEFDAITNPKTSRKDQATIAAKYVDWLWRQAQKHVTDPPADVVDQIWYAKLWHQRPVDVRDGQLHGPALEMARELAERWANDAKAMHRLRAANVVAFGDPNP